MKIKTKIKMHEEYEDAWLRTTLTFGTMIHQYKWGSQSEARALRCIFGRILVYLFHPLTVDLSDNMIEMCVSKLNRSFKVLLEGTSKTFRLGARLKRMELDLVLRRSSPFVFLALSLFTLSLRASISSSNRLFLSPIETSVSMDWFDVRESSESDSELSDIVLFWFGFYTWKLDL